MNINLVNSYESISYTKNTSKKTDSNIVNTFSTNLSTNNVQEVKIQQKNIWKELSEKYDVQNANFEDLQEISQKLYDAGEISLFEHGILTFDYDRATQDIIRHAGVKVAPNFSMYETKANENGQRDWIAEFRAREEKDFKYGNLIGHHNKKNILTILNRIKQE